MKRDTIYSENSPFLETSEKTAEGRRGGGSRAPAASVRVPKFAFDHAVVEVFDDMINRSVPLYQEVQTATAALAARFARPGSVVYDLGSSTGSTLIELCALLPESDIRIIGVDSSEPMMARCRERLREHGLAERVELKHADIGSIEIANASVVIANYTIQFLPPEARPDLCRKIYRGILPGGALLISEKVRHDCSTLQETLTELHHAFKLRNGYSALEISRKRDAIENVLIPLTSNENHCMLAQAGFSTIEQFLKWYTFVSIAAIK